MSGVRARRVIVLGVILSAIWYLLSGMVDLLHLGIGVVAAFVIAATVPPVADHTGFRPLRFLLFLPWLAGQIVISNLRVARLVLSPRLAFRPSFIGQLPGVTGARALTTLGCSITLTPGTLTVDVDEGEIFIHALDAASARDVREQVIARRVREVFPVKAEE